MKMACISIRNIDKAVVVKLDEMAKKKNMSREEYLRQHLETLATSGEIKELENKYESLVTNVLEVVKLNTEVLDRINQEGKVFE